VGIFAGVVALDSLTLGEWSDATTVAGVTFLVTAAICFTLSRVAMWRARRNETVG
jgi:hypothetical protein